MLHPTDTTWHSFVETSFRNPHLDQPEKSPTLRRGVWEHPNEQGSSELSRRATVLVGRLSAARGGRAASVVPCTDLVLLLKARRYGLLSRGGFQVSEDVSPELPEQVAMARTGRAGAAAWFGTLAVATTLLSVTGNTSSHRPALLRATAFAASRQWNVLRSAEQSTTPRNRCSALVVQMKSGPVKGEVRNPWGRAGKPETRAVRAQEAEDNMQLRAKAWRRALSSVRVSACTLNPSSAVRSGQPTVPILPRHVFIYP